MKNRLIVGVLLTAAVSLSLVFASSSVRNALFGKPHFSQLAASGPKGELKEKEPIAGEADDPFGRSNWFMYQRKYPFGEVPENARRKAFQEVLNRGEGLGPDAVGTTWQSIGPGPTTSAFPNNGGVTSGRINAIAISPANTQLILVGSATGGIWRSTNGGTNFTPVSDSQADLAVGAISFAPSNPNVVYAGMGDLDNGYYGTGILKSTDAGATWARVNTAGFPDRGNTTAIKVDPTDPNKVYAAQYNQVNPATGGTFVSGVYVSTNGGANWTNTLPGTTASDLAIHPTNRQIIYAAIRFTFTAGSTAGLYKSTNGGTTWSQVYGSPYTASQASTKDLRVAVTPAAPNRVYVYVGTTETSPPTLQIQRSDDAGETWTNRNPLPTTANGMDPGQFGYNTYIAASPVNADQIYVGGRDVFRSNTGGLTFANINNSFAPPYPNGEYTPNNQKFHADQQAFAFEPGSGTTFYCGNDGGLWKTTDSGATFTSLNATLSLTQFVGLAIDPVNPTRTYAGAQDNGSQRRTTGLGWTEFSGGDGGKLVVNPLNPSMVFHSYVNGSITRNIDNGATYAGQIAEGRTFGETEDGRIGFYPPIVGNGVNAKIYTGTWRLWRCENCDDPATFLDENGTPPTWVAPGGMFDQTTGDNDVLTAIAVSKSNDQVIYTGSRDGRAMASTNGGATWTDITAGLPTRSIANITVSPINPALVYLTVSGYGSGHIFRSTNSGQAWTDISTNLPNIPTSAFLIDPLTPTTLYAGTDIGVFRSTDNGVSWAAFNNGLPPVPVMEFVSMPNGLIQIATYGRGAYELPIIADPAATVSGRVLTPAGIALRNANVVLIDPQGVRRTATTSSFGVFTFTNIPTGLQYIVSVSSKRFRFTPQTITISGNISNIAFTGLE